MKNHPRRRIKTCLWAASITGLAGCPAVRGAFIVTMSGPTTIGGDDVYVLSALNNGSYDSGSTLLDADAIIYSDQANQYLVIDMSDDIDGDGNRDANITGAQDETFGQPQPSFGSALGTFVGISNRATGKYADSSLFEDYVNNPAGTSPSTPADFLSGKGTLDPNFTNRTVSSLEVLTLFLGNGGTLASNAPVPFANIVIPTGVPISFQGVLGGNSGHATAFVGNSSSGILPTVGLLVNGPEDIVGSINVANGQPAAPVSIGSSAQTAGEVVLTGLTTGQDAVYALTITGESSLPQLIASMNTAVGIADPGGFAQAPAPALSALFPGTTVEVVIPTPNFYYSFSWDFSSYITNGSPILTQFAAVADPPNLIPEPSGLRLAGFASAMLFARRRRRSG
jgi:hypothetical protein